MIERLYNFTISQEKTIEKIVDDENLVIGHAVLTKNAEIPGHHTMSNVYVIIVKGQASVEVDEEEPKVLNQGTIFKVPYNTKLRISNDSNEITEIFIVRAPNILEQEK